MSLLTAVWLVPLKFRELDREAENVSGEHSALIIRGAIGFYPKAAEKFSAARRISSFEVEAAISFAVLLSAW